MIRQWIQLTGLAVVALGASMALPEPQVCAADPATARSAWIATAVDGAKVEVPSADRVSVVVFIRPDQAQSRQAIEQIARGVENAPGIQVVLVISGEHAADQARALPAEIKHGWPVVSDPDFAISGTFNIHVWPTTALVRKDGSEAAHLPGLSKSFATDLPAYLDLAAGRIDEAALKKRLGTHEIVSDSTDQMAGRHLQVARRLVDAGQLDQARAQIDAGLALDARDNGLRVLSARVLVLQNHPGDALELLNQLSGDAAPAWQLAVLRSRALIGLNRWDEARALLSDSFKLNPDPSEAHYLLGLVYERDHDAAKASAEFRAAFESTAEGQRAKAAKTP